MTISKNPEAESKASNPEAIAKFAESARAKEKIERTGVNATTETSAIPTDPELKQKAATAVLHENATGEEQGSEELIKELPDPILDHHN